MKLLKPFYILLCLSIFSCSSEEDELLRLDTYMKIEKINLTSASFSFWGNPDNLTKNAKLLYRKKNSTEAYQIKDIHIKNINHENVELTNLEKATEYEVKFQISNKSSKLDSKLSYFTTKAVIFDYDEFFKRYYIHSDFSYTGREHKIIGKGLSDFVNNAKVFLINEKKTDSLEIPSKIVSDSLFFTIPENYLSQNPRESVKQVYVGIKIKDSYQRILNESCWINNRNTYINDYVSNDDDNYLKLRINNSKPYIREVKLTKSYDSECKKLTRLQFNGEFLSDEDYWAPKKAAILIYNAKDNSLVRSYIDNYKKSVIKGCDAIDFLTTYNDYMNNIRKYHVLTIAKTHAYLEKGDYTAKIIFIYDNPKKVVETNTIKFTKK